MIEFLKYIRALLVVVAFLVLSVVLVGLVAEHLFGPDTPPWLAIPIGIGCLYASGWTIQTVYKLITGSDITEIM